MAAEKRGGCMGTLLYSLIVFGATLSFALCLFLGGMFLMCHQVKAENPAAYRTFAREVFGIGPTSSFSKTYELTEEEKNAANSAGLKPEVVADASVASAWASEQGWKVGRDILLALSGGESTNCENCGSVDACNEYMNHPRLDGLAQCAALKELLQEWKEDDIRSSNPIAAKYIYEDYSGVLGSKGGGALGCLQFLAGTAGPHREKVGRPFDLWDMPTAMKTAAAELERLGWSDDLSHLGKIKVLLKWNQDQSFAEQLVSSAQQYARYLGVQRGLVKIFGSESGDVRTKILAFLGLIPDPEMTQDEAEAIVSLDAKGLIQSGDWQIPVKDPIFSSDSKDHANRCAIQYAWDFSVPYGTSIFPAKEGKVVVASCGNESGYGCWVEIDHGEGLHSRYAHMINGSFRIEVGQEVAKDTVLGQVGWTGVTSFGPHVHFEILKNGDRVEPAMFFGKSPQDMGINYQKLANAK